MLVLAVDPARLAADRPAALRRARRRQDAPWRRRGRACARRGRGRAPAGAGAPAAAGPVDAIVTRTAAAAGFPGARVAALGAGRASVSLDAARPQALFGWIAQMEQAGLVVERLRARANADRTVSAELTLRARR